jgi:hypothetical protein
MKKEALIKIWMKIRLWVAIALLLLGAYLTTQPPEYCFNYSGTPPIHECGTKEYIQQKYASYLQPEKITWNLGNITLKNG